jgi:3'-phosphoadenosine 5'-phosphosulfate sulfotransferase (PAPS reductase)/FAD synthetase
LPEQHLLAVEAVVQQVDPLVIMVLLVDQVVEHLETVELVEVQQHVKEMQVEVQMHLLEKVALAVAELELLVEQVEMLQEQQVEQEVLLLLYLL